MKKSTESKYKPQIGNETSAIPINEQKSNLKDIKNDYKSLRKVNHPIKKKWAKKKKRQKKISISQNKANK